MAKSKSLLVGWGGCLLDKTEAVFERGCLSDQLWYFNLVASHVIFLFFLTRLQHICR